MDGDYLTETEMFGLPVVAYQEIRKHFPASEFKAMMGMGHVGVNQVRADRFLQMKQWGYEFISYISPTATIYPQTSIGEGCSIADGCIVLPHASIGNNVRIGTRSIVGHHTTIEDHCFLAVNVVTAGSVTIESCALLGASVTLRDNIRIGSKCVIGAGAVITGDTPPGSVWSAPLAEKLPITSDSLPPLK